MAFRELHSNTLDEKGKTIAREVLQSELCGDHAASSIIVVEGDGIDKSYADRSLIFCDSPVLASNEKIEIRAGRSAFLFYRGVRVAKLPSPSLFTYNWLAKEDLTEDRTLKYENWLYGILAKEMTKIDNHEVLSRVIIAPEGTFEFNMDFDGSTPAPAFIGVMKEHYRDAFLNKSARKLARTMNLFDEPEIPLDRIQEQMLARAVFFLKEIGFDVRQYPIRVMKLHGPMGQAKNGTILIDPIYFRMGTKQLAGTLFEEWFHLSEGCRDESRSMQNFLIDTLMSMGEQIIGSPI